MKDLEEQLPIVRAPREGRPSPASTPGHRKPDVPRLERRILVLEERIAALENHLRLASVQLLDLRNGRLRRIWRSITLPLRRLFRPRMRRLPPAVALPEHPKKAAEALRKAVKQRTPEEERLLSNDNYAKSLRYLDD